VVENVTAKYEKDCDQNRASPISHYIEKYKALKSFTPPSTGGMSSGGVRRLQGVVEDVERTGEKIMDEEGVEWEKCIYTVRLLGFSKRTPDERLPERLKGMRIKLVRWAAFDWHLKKGVRKTLEPDETECVLRGEKTSTVYW